MSSYELNLNDYWRIIVRRRWIILFTILAVLGSVVIFTNMQTPVFQAMATVKVESSLVIPGVATDPAGWDVYTALNTEVKIIKSAIVAERAANKMHLLYESISAKEKQSIIANIQSKVKAERVGETNLINISVTSSDPEETANLANVMARVYIEKGIEDRSRRAKELRRFIQEQLSEAEQKLKKAEEELRRYSEKSGVKGVGGLLANRLVEIETKKSELLKNYTYHHPQIQRLDEQIKSIENQMKKLPKEELEYARLAREVKINEELYTLLAKRFKEAQITEADRVQLAFVVTPAVEPNSPIRPNKTVNFSVGLFLGIFLGFVIALIIENLDTSIGTIEDVEKFLNLPVLGIIPHVEPCIKEKDIARENKHKKKFHSLSSRLAVYYSSKTPFVEAYHTLLTNFKFSILKDKQQKGIILAFTSAGIGEGKTITASNLSIIAAQSGIKTLVIEADLRRPSLHNMFSISRNPGFSDVVLGIKKWREAVRGTTDFLLSGMGAEKILHSPGIENLHILTAGSRTSNPIEIFNSPEIPNIFKELSNEYELILIDCPPVLLFADAILLGSQADATIIIYQVGRMARRALKRAKDQLTSIKTPIKGIILNNVKTVELCQYYDYGYYSSYKYYESKTEDSGNK